MTALLSDLLAVPSAFQVELDRYLHESIQACEASEGVVAGQQLSRWFVRPTLAARVDARLAGAEEAVAGEHRVCLLGEAGSGKTTLLRWLCAREARALLEMTPHARLPLWVEARELPPEAETDRSPITPEYFAGVSHSAFWPAIVRSFWQEGRVLVLCDGLDALPPTRSGQKPRTARPAEWFWRAGHFRMGRGGVPGGAASEGFDLIATSRPVGEAVHLDPRFCHDILSWTEVQIRQYLTTCFPGESSWTELLTQRLWKWLQQYPNYVPGNGSPLAVEIAARELARQPALAFDEARWESRLGKEWEKRWALRSLAGVPEQGDLPLMEEARHGLGWLVDSLAHQSPGWTGEFTSEQLDEALRRASTTRTAPLADPERVARLRGEILHESGLVCSTGDPAAPRYRFAQAAFRAWYARFHSQQRAGRSGRSPALAAGAVDERLVVSRLGEWLELQESAEARDLPYRELAVAQEIGRGRRKLNQPLRAILRGLAPTGLWEKLRTRWAPPRSSLFLLIGDPGSGKSLALRQHARDVLASFRPGGSVPLYLNLHHWRQEGWNDYEPPSLGEVEQSLVTFAERQLEVAAVVDGPKVFSMLRAQGRWIFLFDSFDEMPALLASRSHGNLVRALLAGIRQFVAGGGGRAGCGVLATRDFRRNLSSLALGYASLRIHPFTDRDLQALLKGRNAVETVKAFFKADTGLASVARNPFVGMMLARYLRDHKQDVLSGAVPTRAKVYEHFMGSRLQEAFAYMQQQGWAPPREELRNLLACIAASLLEESAERQGGLEFEAARLRRPGWTAQNAAHCVQALQIAGLLRGAEMAPTVSFSHRRFAEYFAACSLTDRDAALKKAGEVLRNDNHPWRDAMVVYCDKEKSAFLRGVVRQSWPLIAPLLERAELTQRRKTDARVALDFLLEAVRGRPKAMGAYQEELADFMVGCARDPRQRLLEVRQAAEWAGLLSGPTLTRALSAVLERGSWWVMEGALFSCRYHGKPTLTLIRRIVYVLELNPLKLILDRSGIVSSLRRSHGFQAAWRRAQWRRVDLIALMVTIPTAAALTKSPSIILFYAILLLWQRHMVWNEPENKLPPPAWFRRWRRDVGFDLVLPGTSVWEVILRFSIAFGMFKCLWYGGAIATFDVRWHTGAGALVTAAAAFALLPLFLLSSVLEFFAVIGWLIAYLAFFSIVGIILKGVMQGAGYVLALEPGWGDRLFDVFFDWIWGMLLFGICVYPLLWWWYGRKDRRFLKRESGDFAPGSTVSREEISKDFLKLKQERGRMKFLDILERNVSEVRGDWPVESKAGLRNKPDHERLNNLDRGWRANEELREPPDSEG